MALHASETSYELREVVLRNKPSCMLAASPKASVPVLLLPDGRVIDESWDIMQWALRQHDPEGWLGEHQQHIAASQPLIASNDSHFKHYLDRYKYADRYPEQSRSDYRELAEIFLQQLEQRLNATRYLLGNTLSIADAGIFPFVRQFAEVDREWFAQAPYPALHDWLENISGSARFAAVMQKHPPWQPDGAPAIIVNGAMQSC